MPSFDLVSSMNIGELKNALNMAKKLIAGRYDFKGSKCSVDLKTDTEIEIIGDSEYQVKTALDILYSSMGKRGLSLKGLEPKEIKSSGLNLYKLQIIIHCGINKDNGKLINKIIKSSGLKVSSQYLDDKIRITGKKIDALQDAFKILREHKDIIIDLTMENMK